MKPEIIALFISPGHDFKGRHEKGRLDHGILSVDTVECVAGRGLVGDRYFPHEANHKGQITFFNEAIYRDIQVKFNQPEVPATVFRRNVIIRGVDLNAWIGQRFTIQGVEFEGSEECAPCYWMDEAVAPGVYEALKGNGGLRARILSSGTLSVGPVHA
ncbi:MAG: MOSC domain-containing protein YiiM [Kiritimatiellia bacterium]|jgi:MOSC domain-containing protein YiiM